MASTLYEREIGCAALCSLASELIGSLTDDDDDGDDDAWLKLNLYFTYDSHNCLDEFGASWVHLSLSNVALAENIRTTFIFKQKN